MLEIITCREGGSIELSKILLVPEKQLPTLQAYRSTVCGSTEGQRSERFRQMSLKLREQINMQSVTKKVDQKHLLWIQIHSKKVQRAHYAETAAYNLCYELY